MDLIGYEIVFLSWALAALYFCVVMRQGESDFVFIYKGFDDVGTSPPPISGYFGEVCKPIPLRVRPALDLSLKSVNI